MVQVQLMLYAARRLMRRLEPLAAAEEAANNPPVPGSSQAAYNAACQRYYVLFCELLTILRRCSKC